MKRLKFNSLLVPFIVSVLFHYGLLSLFPIKSKSDDQKHEKYEVKLIYSKQKQSLEKTMEAVNEAREQKAEEKKAEDEHVHSEAASENEGETVEKSVKHLHFKNESSAPDLTQVFEELYNRIAAKKIYPNAARRKGLQGIVLVLFILDENGNLIEVNVKHSSGHKVLDRAALSLVKKVVPYEHGLGKSIMIEIPVKYSIAY